MAILSAILVGRICLTAGTWSAFLVGRRSAMMTPTCMGIIGFVQSAITRKLLSRSGASGFGLEEGKGEKNGHLRTG